MPEVEPKASRIEITQFRRAPFVVVFVPILFVFTVGLYYLARDAVYGFPDRRPILLFYEIGFAAVAPHALWYIFKILYRVLIVHPTALFIEDGYLVNIDRKIFCVPVKDALVTLSPGENIFQKLILSWKNGVPRPIALLTLDKSGPEIIDAIDANR